MEVGVHPVSACSQECIAKDRGSTVVLAPTASAVSAPVTAEAEAEEAPQDLRIALRSKISVVSGVSRASLAVLGCRVSKATVQRSGSASGLIPTAALVLGRCASGTASV